MKVCDKIPEKTDNKEFHFLSGDLQQHLRIEDVVISDDDVLHYQHEQCENWVLAITQVTTS